MSADCGLNLVGGYQDSSGNCSDVWTGDTAMQLMLEDFKWNFSCTNIYTLGKSLMNREKEC